jgi:hypothetical protein
MRRYCTYVIDMTWAISSLILRCRFSSMSCSSDSSTCLREARLLHQSETTIQFDRTFQKGNTYDSNDWFASSSDVFPLSTSSNMPSISFLLNGYFSTDVALLLLIFSSSLLSMESTWPLIFSQWANACFKWLASKPAGALPWTRRPASPRRPRRMSSSWHKSWISRGALSIAAMNPRSFIRPSRTWPARDRKPAPAAAMPNMSAIMQPVEFWR